MVKGGALSNLEVRQRLENMLKEMAKLKSTIKELTKQYGDLQEKAFPFVEAAGDVYEVEGIKAQIVRPKKWEVDAILLLNKFGEKIHHLLIVSASKFRLAFDAGLLGTQKDLEGIAKLVDETPRFLLDQK